MKEAVEKWIPCTGTFPDYEICIGPFIAIRRIKTAQGSFKGRRIAIQHYRGKFWVTMRDRFGVTKRVNVLDMANWAAAAEWRRKTGAKQAEADPADDSPTWRTKREWIAASEPLPMPPRPAPPTREKLLAMRSEIERANYAESVKRREIREIDAQLAALELEAAGWKSPNTDTV